MLPLACHVANVMMNECDECISCSERTESYQCEILQMRKSGVVRNVLQ